jgi:hypothetical protein
MDRRCLATLLLSVVLIGQVGFFKTQLLDPLDPMVRNKPEANRFWALKTHRNSRYDGIILGDSRVYRGISPQAMQTVLPSYRFLNFGYSSGGLNPTMYQEAEQRLDPSTEQPLIILVFSPHSLTPESAKNEHFLEEKNRKPEEIFERIYIAPLLQFFAPISPETVMYIVGKTGPDVFYYQEFEQDGWVASWTVPEDPTRAIASYRDVFTDNQVSERLVFQALQQTRSYVDRGILVFGCRSPADPGLIALEDVLSGFQEQRIAAGFAEAGGTWLTFPASRYKYYDGSHLKKDSAIQFSLDLANAIKPYLQTSP